jgi:hypothetical protein
VFDSDVGLQGVALRARVGVSAEEGAEADEFGELAEEWVDDGEVGDDDGDKGLAAGPETTADCAFWAGLEGLVSAKGFVDVLDDGRLTVRIVTARMVPASTMNTAPLNSSINVNLRLRVVSTPHRSYCMSANTKPFSGLSLLESHTGNGIDSRYISVMMLRTNTVNTYAGELVA